MSREEYSVAEAGVKKLDYKIMLWQSIILMILFAMLIAYFSRLGVACLEGKCAWQESWGQFGDYIGGILNPLVAFAAFYWLTQAVKLQKEELEATRRELRIAADAQGELVENGRKSIKLSAMTALASAIDNKISSINYIIEKVNESQKIDRENGHGGVIAASSVEAERIEFIRKAKILEEERDYYLEEMRKIIESKSPTADEEI